MKLKLTVEYAGEDFAGWQRQAGLTTVQGSLESAIEIFLRGECKKLGLALDSFPEVMGSGRTDSGVHARAQVGSFLWPSEVPFVKSRVKEALNAITPPGLIVREIEEVEENFDARRTPHLKCYSYRIIYRGGEERAPPFIPYDRNRAWCVNYPLNLREMILCARILEGQHDFQSFRAADCTAGSTVRTVIRSELVRTGEEELRYYIVGKGFLKQMVRIIVGTLVDFAKAGRSAEEFRSVLEARDRARAGQTAPAAGLCLEWVRYSGENLL